MIPLFRIVFLLPIRRIKICPASIGKSDEGIHNNPHNPPCEIRDNQRKIFSPTKEYTTIHVFSISPPIAINIKSNKGTYNNPPCEIRNNQRKIFSPTKECQTTHVFLISYKNDYICKHVSTNIKRTRGWIIWIMVSLETAARQR